MVMMMMMMIMNYDLDDDDDDNFLCYNSQALLLRHMSRGAIHYAGQTTKMEKNKFKIRKRSSRISLKNKIHIPQTCPLARPHL